MAQEWGEGGSLNFDLILEPLTGRCQLCFTHESLTVLNPRFPTST